ncbi:MAG TPA: hypothetical protein ENI27_08260 [bacterium]|nr:hypothetical protein [bacterium]
MSRSTKKRVDPQRFVGRQFTRTMDIAPRWWVSTDEIERWAVVHSIRVDKPFKIKRNLLQQTITISQWQGPPAARIYLAQSELP